jgi:glycopeptide antibiotics resistance protein
MTAKPVKIFLWIALISCMLVLTKYILFKKSPRYYKNYFAREYKRYKVSDGWDHANLKPFSTIRLFSSRRVSSEYSYKNIGGNIIGFLPLGILLPLLIRPLRKFVWLTGAVFLLSLSFEMAQLITGVGVFDVDDLILNTAGGIGGYILYALARWLIRREPAATESQLVTNE